MPANASRGRNRSWRTVAKNDASDGAPGCSHGSGAAAAAAIGGGA
jgi:hypothetical protein